MSPNFILLYVANPPASADFYTGLLGVPTIEASPTFAMLKLDGGQMLGLWKRDTVEPAAPSGGVHGELAFAVESAEVVEAHHRDWSARGLTILQAPTRMDFGQTFTATDPDGHRLRVFCPG